MPVYALRVNGRTHEVDAQPEDCLLSVLRHDLALTGSKYGCGEGHCGACTVLIDGQAVRSCVTRIGRLGKSSITTIEGLAESGRLHAVQQAFLETEAFQCGYCTPGMVMATVSFLEENPSPAEADIREALEGNLCRCTGYHNIVRAVQTAAGVA